MSRSAGSPWLARNLRASGDQCRDATGQQVRLACRSGVRNREIDDTSRACAGPDMYARSRLAPALLRRASHGKVDRSISMDGPTCVRPAGVPGEHDGFTFVPSSDPGDQICQPGGIAGRFVIGPYRRAQTRLTGQVRSVDPTSGGERAE